MARVRVRSICVSFVQVRVTLVVRVRAGFVAEVRARQDEACSDLPRVQRA